MCASLADAEDVFRCRVEFDNQQRAVEQNDACAQVVEYGLGMIAGVAAAPAVSAA